MGLNEYLEFLKEVLLYPDGIQTDDELDYYYYKDNIVYFLYTPRSNKITISRQVEDILSSYGYTLLAMDLIHIWIKYTFNLKLEVS